MRGITDTAFFLLVLIYWMLTILAWISIRRCFKSLITLHNKTFTYLYFGLGIIQSIIFVVLFRYLPSSRAIHFYSLYFYFNGVFATDIFIKIPLTISTLFSLVSHNTLNRYKISCMGIILSSGMLLTFFWGIIIGPGTLGKSEVSLEFGNLPEAFDGFRIVQFSDTHFGSFHRRRMLKKMAEINNEFSPDIVVFTGDLVNNIASEAGKWSAILRSFNSEYGKYAILGNHDYGDYSKWKTPQLKAANFSLIKKAYNDCGFQLLNNESETIVYGGESIYITGVENWGRPPFHQYADLKKAECGVPDNTFRILLAHDPAYWESKIISDCRYPLCLSGHTHGFQWGIKLAGIQFSMIYFIRKYWGGLYENEGRFLYVNRGTGFIGMPVRIDMPAEITLIKLKRK